MHTQNKKQKTNLKPYGSKPKKTKHQNTKKNKKHIKQTKKQKPKNLSGIDFKKPKNNKKNHSGKILSAVFNKSNHIKDSSWNTKYQKIKKKYPKTNKNTKQKKKSRYKYQQKNIKRSK